MFYTYATYITKSWRKKNKQARTWVSPKHRKGEDFGNFLAFLCICGYRERVSERNSHTGTRNADPSFRADLWVDKSQLLLQQFPLSDRHLSLTVANSSFFSALGSYLSSSSSGPVGNLACKPFVWASYQNKGILWVAPTLTYTHRTNAHHRITGPEWTCEQWQWRSTPYSSKLQGWNLAVKWFNMICKTLV